MPRPRSSGGCPGGQEWFEQRITRSGRLVAIASREVTAARDDVERRRRLSRISEALASAETPEQVCVVITDLALPLAGASSGGVIAQDEDPGWIVRCAGSGSMAPRRRSSPATR